jgi:ADP-ribose pyrophosphatase
LLIDCGIESAISNLQSAVCNLQFKDQMPIIYKGRVFSVDVDTRRFPDGREHEVAVVRHPPSVVLIPIEHDGRVVLIKQYRASVDRELWELPAGSLEPGESADAAARRECEEEIGRAPARVERIGAWYPTPGFCDEELIFFRVSDLRAPAPDSPHKPDDDEDIQPKTLTIKEARGMVARGEIVDLKTAFGLTLV